MRIIYANTEIAREGDGYTDVIELSPLSRNGVNESIEIIGSPPKFYNRRNTTYSIKATVPYFCNSREEAQTKLREIGKLLDSLTEGDLSVELETEKIELANASATANFPDETVDGFFEVEYIFEGKLK